MTDLVDLLHTKSNKKIVLSKEQLDYYKPFLDSIEPPSLILETENSGKLYLGGLDVIRNGTANELYEHIISIIEKKQLAYFTHKDFSENTKVVKHHFDIKDRCSENISEVFDTISDLINELLEQGKSVYIHCFLGVSRSSSVVLAYLIKYRKMNFEKSLTFLTSKRSTVAPNLGFTRQLVAYEKSFVDKNFFNLFNEL